MAETLAPDRVLPLLTGKFGSPYLYEESCESTQQLLAPGLPEGAVAVCEEQTAGRGRLGRAWEAPRGGAILCSILLRPPAARPAAELSLVGGLAAACTVEHATGLAAQIKWPNDVMVNRRKVAGVLAEGRDGAVVLGIGVNVNQTRAELPVARIPPASLFTLDAARRDRAPLLAGLLAELEACYRLWLDAGLDSLFGELGARDFLRGRQVTVDGLSGVAVGVRRDGLLELDIGGDHRAVVSGDVTFRR